MTASAQRIVPLRPAPRPGRTVSLLDFDADLAEAVPPELHAEARRQLLARVVRLAPGPLEASVHGAAVVQPGHAGLLMLDGLVGRELLAEDVASLELLGPGDLVRPWQALPDEALLLADVRWSVLAEARVAVIDPALSARLGRYPGAHAVLIERLTSRALRLAVTQTICQLNRVDRRVLTMLWHLAGRWGRVTPEGTLIPLSISHRMLAQLVGARRPTVSTACAELARRGEVRRRADGTWLLTGTPVGSPTADVLRYVPPRRRMLQAAPDGDVVTPLGY